jgi:hypothetical protein
MDRAKSPPQRACLNQHPCATSSDKASERSADESRGRTTLNDRLVAARRLHEQESGGGQRSLFPFVIHRRAAHGIASVGTKSEHALGEVGMDDVNTPTEGEIDDTHALIALALPPLCALWFFLGLVAGLAFRG